MLAELGGGRCRVRVGGWCERPGDYPRSYREAQLALKIPGSVRSGDRARCYDDLGVYRILAEVEDPAVDPDGKLPPDERRRRAEHARRAYMLRLEKRAVSTRGPHSMSAERASRVR